MGHLCHLSFQNHVWQIKATRLEATVQSNKTLSSFLHLKKLWSLKCGQNLKVATKINMTRITGNCCSLLVIVGCSKLALAHLLMAQLSMDPAALRFALNKILDYRAAREWIQLDNKWDWTQPLRPTVVSLKREDTVRSWYRAALSRTVVQRTRRHSMQGHKRHAVGMEVADSTLEYMSQL